MRQIFLQPDHATAIQTWRHVADQLRVRWPKLGTCMDAAEHDVLAYMTFPAQHRVKLHRSPISCRRASTAASFSSALGCQPLALQVN